MDNHTNPTPIHHHQQQQQQQQPQQQQLTSQSSLASPDSAGQAVVASSSGQVSVSTPDFGAATSASALYTTAKRQSIHIEDADSHAEHLQRSKRLRTNRYFSDMNSPNPSDIQPSSPRDPASPSA